MQTNPLNRSQIIRLILVFILFVISVSLYAGRGNEYAAPTPKDDGINLTNPLVLQNWLPTNSYNYTLARLRDYAQTRDISTKSITVASPVTTDGGAYDFTITYNPSTDKHVVLVYVSNFDSILSTAVLIDGQKQTISHTNATQSAVFSGVDELVNEGLSSAQASSLQKALLQFKPGAHNFIIDTANVSQSSYNPDNPSQAQTFSFPIKVDGSSYNAKLDYTDLTAIVLQLEDNSNKRVFDSGRVSND